MPKPSKLGDVLVAETPHVALVREFVAVGGFREWRMERLIESLITLRKTDATTPAGADARLTAKKTIVEYAFRMVVEYGESLPPAEADKLYGWGAEMVMNRMGRSGKDSE